MNRCILLRKSQDNRVLVRHRRAIKWRDNPLRVCEGHCERVKRSAASHCSMWNIFVDSQRFTS